VTKYLGSPVEPATVFYVAHVLEDRKVGQLVSLDESRPRVIGRTEGDFVFAQDDFLSGSTCNSRCRDGQCVVSDLGSRNGVYLRIAQPTALSAGQMLLFGRPSSASRSTDGRHKAFEPRGAAEPAPAEVEPTIPPPRPAEPRRRMPRRSSQVTRRSRRSERASRTGTCSRGWWGGAGWVPSTPRPTSGCAGESPSR